MKDSHLKSISNIIRHSVEGRQAIQLKTKQGLPRAVGQGKHTGVGRGAKAPNRDVYLTGIKKRKFKLQHSLITHAQIVRKTECTNVGFDT